MELRKFRSHSIKGHIFSAIADTQELILGFEPSQ